MPRPLIALSGRRKRGRQVNDFPSSLSEIEVDLYFADYARGVYRAGGLPVHLPFDADPADYAGRFDGLLLPGGADIDPARYGGPEMPDEFVIEPARDDLESALLDLAVAESLPVVGICRGMQLINVHGGGTLHQDVPPHSHFDKPPNAEIHDVAFAPDSRLAGIYGSRRAVNSLHHQTIDRLAPGLRAVGHADDGTIEAIEAEDRPWLAVQWHPEMMDSRDIDPIFDWLVRHAASPS